MIMVLLCALLTVSHAQLNTTNPKKRLAKIHHAEPLYMDLVRDLGARKGEHELNVGWGLTNKNNYVGNNGFVEYEFSPINRLGLEVEVPFSIEKPVYATNRDGEKLVSKQSSALKLASQYTFAVWVKHQLSLAVGYMHEIYIGNRGTEYSPFFVIGKKWGQNFHSLIYTGPVWKSHPNMVQLSQAYQMNVSVHYIIPKTFNLIGVECNTEFYGDEFDVTFRPQTRVQLSESIHLGVLTGIPLYFSQDKISFMTRLIYIPQSKRKRG